MVAIKAANRRRQSRRDRGSGERGGRGGEVAARLKESVVGATRYVKEQARSIREATSEASQQLLQTVQEEAERAYARQKGRAAARVKGIAKIGKQAAHALHAVKADRAAEYVEQASSRVGQATGYLEDHTLTEIIEDAGEVVRRNQTLAVGGLFIAGFVVTRFLKASASRNDEARSDAPDDAAAADEDRGRIEASDRGPEDEEEDGQGDEAVGEFDQADDEADRGEGDYQDEDADEEGDSPDDAPAGRGGTAARDRTPGRGRPGR
jgi:hypothetical protein